MQNTRPPLLLIPGLLCDATVWEPAIARLEDRFAIQVADLSTQDSIAAMAADQLALLEGPLLVAGHSMGARVALELYRQAPERVSRLALLDTGVHPLADGERARRQAIIQLAHEQGMEALAERWLPPMVYAPYHQDAALMGRLRAMVLRMNPDLHERQITALIGRPDARPLLEQIACPTLVLVGRHDAWSPLAQHEYMQAHIRGSRLVVIEGAGHFAPLEQPQAVADALEAWATA
ncbi:MAG TPA: alpha/beta fold hydrolase [Thiolinea sp.]|nr:alpha/beta fold hydrolase [Thiolinea sp.]